MPVVVVESPAKAKTINSYLGGDYTVLASFGHVRDLPPKDGSVNPDDGFAMEWEVGTDSKKHVKAIADALKDDQTLILATDPDREGEAISWHLQEALTKRKALKKGAEVSRVVFNAITRSAVTEAMKTPRPVDMELVEAYLARRALDYLVGFNLSPVLWRKLPGAKSAGRVQSVALRIVTDREMEIEAFRAREYWSVRAMLDTPRGQGFEARLVVMAGKRLDRYEPATEAEAGLAVKAVSSRALAVRAVESKPVNRNPAPPFMTSTLQQEASRKFGFGARLTMSAAQRLYEAGHITYMRTDGIDMAPEAVKAARATIAERFGDRFVPDKPRIYKNKAKNAQEAHECIRPTDMAKGPNDLRIGADDQRKLYELIWKRTIASQMAAARLERTTITVTSPDADVELRATGQVVLFEGFLKVYEEGRDDGADEEGRRLPQVAEGDALRLRPNGMAAEFGKIADGGARAATTQPDGLRAADGALMGPEGGVLGQRHFTQPPPRYTEATLVKRMEELGIGRPSTYASILDTIQNRGYVRKEKNRLIPEDKGRLVTAFLTNYFRRYVEYDFTAGLEDQLDEVSAGDRAYKDVLGAFWRDFSAAISETADLRIGDVLERINEMLGPHLFPAREDGADPRLCPRCGGGRLSMRTSRAGGAFIGCSNYPECRYTRPFGPPGGGKDDGDDRGDDDLDGKLLGVDPNTSRSVHLHNGRFGWYVQSGDAATGAEKPPRASLPRFWGPEAMDLDKALRLLNLPRKVGDHPEDGGPIETGLGRYGPYVMHTPKDGRRIYADLSGEEEVFTLGMNRAVELLAVKAAGGGRGRGAMAPPLKSLGEHPEKGGPINVMKGRYGPYVKWDKINASLPRGMAPEDVTLDMAVGLIAERQARGGKGTGKRRTAKRKS